MKSLIIITIFLGIFYMIDAIRSIYVERDIDSKSDAYNAHRKNWHAAQICQATLLLVFLCICSVHRLQFNFPWYLLVPIFMLCYSFMLDNFRNMLRGKSFFYVEKDNKFAKLFHTVGDKIGIPAEILMISCKIALLILTLTLCYYAFR